MAFLEEFADEIFDSLPSSLIRSYPDFVSLGPGNGYKDRTLLRSLSNKLLGQGLNDYIYYYPADIAQESWQLRSARPPDMLFSKSGSRSKPYSAISSGSGSSPRFMILDLSLEVVSLLENNLGNLVHDGEFLKKAFRTMHEGRCLCF